MKRLLSAFLRPYWKQLTLVVSLVLIQSFANLYLPSLMAQIINNGVSLGNTGYIMRIGAYMLLVTLLLGVSSIFGVYWGSKTAMAFGRDVRSSLFRKVESFSQNEINQFGAPSLITRNTNDVQQVQMMVAIGSHRDDRSTDHGYRRHHHGPAAGRAAVRHARSHPAGDGSGAGSHSRPRHTAVPRNAGEARPHQPGHARDPERRAGHPGVRSRTTTRNGASTKPTRI